MRKTKPLPAAYAAPTKDTRNAGNFEVLVPVAGRVKPHRVPMHFTTQESAETWIHSPEGKEAVAQILDGRS
jgi:hypothetical protein